MHALYDELARAGSEQKPSYMCHKATVRQSVGGPAVTIARAMSSMNFTHRDGYHSEKVAKEIATRPAHLLEEFQAWQHRIPMYWKQMVAAHSRTHPGEADVASILKRCPHIVVCDPMQSSCRDCTVEKVSSDGRVVNPPHTVTMPWKVCTYSVQALILSGVLHVDTSMLVCRCGSVAWALHPLQPHGSFALCMGSSECGVASSGF